MSRKLGRREQLAVERATVSVRRTFTKVRGQSSVLGPPTSRAGVRTVSLPSAVEPALLDHLSVHVSSASEALVLTADNGKPIWRRNFNRLVDRKAAGRT